MAASGRDVEMKTYSSSPELSSPPSDFLSDAGDLDQGRANIAQTGDEIIVDTASRFNLMRQQQQKQQQLSSPSQGPPYPEGVKLTKNGVPRKKPGRKPGTTVKPADGGTPDAPKQRRPRKPKDPNAPPIQRKRKVAPTADEVSGAEQRSFSAGPDRQPKITELTSMRMDIDSRPAPPSQPAFADKAPKRESLPSSMQSILNADPSPPSQPPAPVRSSGQSYDPIRSSNYDPVRETMLARDPYGTGPLGSPRAPTQMTNRASASPSIASLVDPPPFNNVRSPPTSQQSYSNGTSQPKPRAHESDSLPPSPSHAVRSASQTAPKSATTEVKRPPPPPPVPASTKPLDADKPATTTTTSSFKDVAMTTVPLPPKKVASILQQERAKHPKTASASSSPKITATASRNKQEPLPPVPDLPTDRSILDFGKAKPGEDAPPPTIVLHIPLNGETNKYVNFMRLAEERYGWDALHPRLAAHRDRKARIAAATAALEKTGSGRESGDEMSVDLQSGGEEEGSNVEGPGGQNGGGGGGTSGADGGPVVKPVRKKRNFKEDEYDRDDDFVDDSELLWEEQAAASRDGFFVYSGPLVPEVEKPAAGTEGPPKRGRGGRGGRGGSTRGGASGRGTGRGGGPGSRGGSITRKPRMTKLEKAQLDREKAERERIGQMASKAGSSGGGGGLATQGAANPPFAAGMVVDV